MAIEKKPVHGEFKKHVDILKNHEEHAKYKSVVDTAIKRLGEAKHPDAFPHIVKFLESKNEFYRRHAISALGNLGMEEALPHLERLKKDSSIEQYHILNVMLKITEQHPARRKEINNEQMEILKNHEEHAEGSAVSWAIKWLGNARHPDAFPHIVKFLKSEKASYRFNAIKALGNLEMEEALPHLAERFRKNNHDEQDHILNAMMRINREKALPMIIELHGKANAYGKMNIEKILKKIEGAKDGD